MRVVVVTTDFPPLLGGIASLFSDLSRALSARGPVTVLAPRARGAEDFDRRQSYRVIRVGGPPPLREAVMLRHLARLDRTEGVDAVVCASWVPAGLVGYLGRICRGTPYLVWAHGSEIVDDWLTPRRAVKLLLRPLKRSILSRAAAVVANSRYTRGLVVGQGVSPSRVEVIEPAVDAGRFTPSAPAAARARYRRGAAHCLLTVARLDRHKGHDLVIRALAGSLRDLPGLRYLIAGSGEAEAALRRLAASLGVETQVEFLGDVPPEELPDLYRAADVFVMPTDPLPGRLDYVEGFGIVYLEASASGKPIVAARSGGVEDAVLDGATGLLVPPGDAEAVGRAIRTLIEDPMLAARLGQAGRARVEALLNLDVLADRVLTLARSRLSAG